MSISDKYDDDAVKEWLCHGIEGFSHDDADMDWLVNQNYIEWITLTSEDIDGCENEGFHQIGDRVWQVTAKGFDFSDY